MNWFLKWGLLLLLGAIPAVVTADTRFILKTQPNKLASVLARYNLKEIREISSGSGDTSHVVSSASSVSAAQLAAVTRNDSDVRSIEADSDLEIEESRRTLALPASPSAIPACAFDSTAIPFFSSFVRAGYVQQPANAFVGVSAAHSKGITGAGIVAIIDTGVDPFHPALRASLLPGYDFTRDLPGIASDWLDLPPAVAGGLAQSTVAILDTGRPTALLNQSTVAILDQSTVAILDQLRAYQSFGHGTMVAGLIHLVAPTAKILPLKAFRADGAAKLSDIARAIRYAVDHKAAVINLSFSMASNSSELSDALLYAKSKKVIVVASAGNAGRESAAYPASSSGVIGVGSVNLADLRSYFSNYESNAKTSAPGEALLTTYPGARYAAVWGTSFSAALVSGAVALFEQVNKSLDPGKAKDALNKGKVIRQEMGDARLDLVRILEYLTSH